MFGCCTCELESAWRLQLSHEDTLVNDEDASLTHMQMQTEALAGPLAPVLPHPGKTR